MLRDRFTWVEREDTQIHLVPVDAPVPAREGHVAVVADDYEATLARLRTTASSCARAATRGMRRGRSCATRPGISSK